MQQGDRSRKLAVLLSLMLGACEKADRAEKAPAALPKVVEQRACSDPSIVARLRELIIARASGLKPADAKTIEQVGGAARHQLDEIVVSERDPALDLIICRAQLRFELPDGATDAFGNSRQLAADLRYAVQRTAGGVLTVHQLDGADPLAYRLASVPMRMAPPPPVPSRKVQAEPDVRPVERSQRRSVARRAPPPPPRRGLPEPALSSRGRPSFDCRRAGSRVERMICGDERLAALDRVAASLYGRTLARSDRGTRALLRQTQARFIDRRDDCRRAGCVADRYRDRLDEIDAIASR